MSQQDTKLQNVQYKTIDFIPKLRRNKRTDLRWGNGYYEALKTAVFDTQNVAFMPEEPPQNIRDTVDKTGYVCKQCKDCFRYLSSIEEHTTRRSWVLGFWCQRCFLTTCIHKIKGRPNCSNCTDLENSKHDYLTSKGIKKNMKKGVTKIFYNQCQFFAHLKEHGIAMVDTSELMLMPLPSDVKPENYNRCHKIWKAVMEIMFVKRIHIMDWIRDKKINWNAITNVDSKHNDPIADIVNSYCKDCIGFVNKIEHSQRQDNPIQFEDSRVSSKNSLSHGNFTQSGISSRDARCNARQASSARNHRVSDTIVPKDIAFVDCGSFPTDYTFEASDLTTPDHGMEIPENNKNACEKSSPNVIVAKETATRDNPTLRSNSIQRRTKHRDKLQCASHKSSEDQTNSSPLPFRCRTAPRILRIRNPTNLSLCTIMNNLPNDPLNRNKKIVVSDKNSQPENGISASSDSSSKKLNSSPSLETTLSNNVKSPILFAAINDKKSKSSMEITEKSTNVSNNTANNVCTPVNAISQSFSEQMSLHGKILFQNGRKYIIRHVQKSHVQDLKVATKLLNGGQRVTSSKRLILPKPASTTITVEKASTTKFVDDGKPRKLTKILPKSGTPWGLSLMPLHKSLINKNRKSQVSPWHQSFVVKIRESMENEFRKIGRKKQNSYIDNLKEINEAYAKSTGFTGDPIIIANLQAIERFEKLASLGSSENSGERDNDDDDGNNDEVSAIENGFERNAKNWETNMLGFRKRTCGICRKRSKPASYTVGMSPPATDESIYCHCYNNICHFCNVSQANLVQLKIHLKWHKREKPFACPDCARVFETANDLEVHAWTACLHPMARHIYGCAVCNIDGMMDMESVTRHFMLVHAKRKIICPECKLEYTKRPFTPSQCNEHFAEHHPKVTNVPEPMLLLVCSLKQCVVWPELYRAHLSNHTGIMKSTYYECPFCTITDRETRRDKSTMLRHLTERHLNRLHEVASPESLPEIIEKLRLHAITDDESPVSNFDTSGPMIINARTITPESFEHGSQDCQDFQERSNDSNLPKILEVRSVAVDPFGDVDATTNDRYPLITAVESTIDHPSDRPSIDSPTDDGLSRESAYFEITSMTTENVERNFATEFKSSVPMGEALTDDSSNSNFTPVIYENSAYKSINLDFSSGLPKLERKPLSWSEENEESRDCDAFADRRSPISETMDTNETIQKPRRIALNNPTTLETTPVSYNCHICGELIDTSWSVVKKHFASRHPSDYELSVLSPQIPQITSLYIDGGYKNDWEARKRRSDVQSTNPGPKRRRRWGPKKSGEKSLSPSHGLCVKPEPVCEIEGTFRCKKCDEPFDGITQMREHIASKHRLKGQYLICLECGENFVVVPSLQMHLKAIHNVQDPTSYLAEHVNYVTNLPEDTEEDESTAESNQCYVCMAVFADKAAVDKHIRVHGMAFLKRNRFEARKAQKCGKLIVGSTTPDGNVGISDDKMAKNVTEDTKVSSINFGESKVDSYVGNSNDRIDDGRRASSFSGEKLDASGGIDAMTNSGDTSSCNARDCSTTSESDVTREMETTGSSQDA